MESRQYKVATNGITMQVTEMGEGPLVILCHGFPELGYSWRHQLRALAEAGFRAVAPDQRGYGQTDCPAAIEDYDIFQLTGDIVGLVHALNEERAVIAGHDWGATVAAHCALLRPDLFTALILMSVPYPPRKWGDTPPTGKMKKMAGSRVFYMNYFQEPGRAEADFEADVRTSVIGMLYAGSGDPPPEARWRVIFGADERLSDTFTLPDALPEWLSEADIDYYTAAFEKTGYRGGLNWYRNLDRNWALTPFLTHARILQPTLFLAGSEDGVIAFMRKAYDELEKAVPNLYQKELIPGAGHWIQQERPQAVSERMIHFLTQGQ